MGIRLFLVLNCCLLAAIPAALFWLWPQADLKNIEIELATDRHQRIAEELATRLELYGQDVNSIVRLVAQQPTKSAARNPASRLLASKNINCVCVYDANTLTLTRSVLAGPVPCKPELTPDNYDRLLTYLGENFSRFSPIETGHPDGAVLLLPLQLESEFVVAALDPGFIEKIGRSVRFGNSGHVAIIDHAGNVLSHPKDEWNSSHKNVLATDAFRETIEGNTGLKRFRSPATEQEMIAGTARVPQFGWGVLVPQPVAEIHEKVNQFDNNSLLVIGLGLFLAMLAALAIARLVGTPIEQFTKAAMAVSRGDLDARFPRRTAKMIPRELRVANVALKRMTEALQRNAAELELAANSDSLTGLPNRKSFTESAQMLLQQSEVDRIPFAVCFIDLNRFKAINDNYGHRRGDELLVTIARRLQRLLKKNQSSNPGATFIAGRLGGDEFAVAVSGLDTTTMHVFATGLAEQFALPFRETGDYSISSSIGIAKKQSSACVLSTLLHFADVAMYRAKQQGDNQIVFYKAQGAANLVAEK